MDKLAISVRMPPNHCQIYKVNVKIGVLTITSSTRHFLLVNDALIRAESGGVVLEERAASPLPPAWGLVYLLYHVSYVALFGCTVAPALLT